MAALVITLNVFQDLETFVHGKYCYMLYYLALAIYPRMLFTVLSIAAQRAARQPACRRQGRQGHRRGRQGGAAQENHRVPNAHESRRHRPRGKASFIRLF